MPSFAERMRLSNQFRSLKTMVKAYRVVGKSETPRYKQLKEKLIELGKRDGEIGSRNFAAYIGVFSESSARNWLVLFEADGLIKLVARYRGGEKAYMLTDSCTTNDANLRPQTQTTNNPKN
jgi:hypothetical protein